MEDTGREGGAGAANAIAQCEACASLAEYSAAAARLARMLAGPEVVESVTQGNHLVALAEWARGQGQAAAQSVLEYLVGRGRSQAPAYGAAVRVAYGHAAGGWSGRERAAAVAGAFRRGGVYRAPRGSPISAARAIGAAAAAVRPPPGEEPLPTERPPDTDARPHWAALAARCATAPARGIPFDIAEAMFDALHAATAEPEHLGPNVEAARAMFQGLAGSGEAAAEAVDCEAAGLFAAIVENGVIDLIEAYTSRYGVPSDDARREAIGLVEAWSDSFPPGERPDEAAELVAILRDAPVHETEEEPSALAFAD